jgi:hypothetical protein
MYILQKKGVDLIEIRQQGSKYGDRLRSLFFW